MKRSPPAARAQWTVAEVAAFLGISRASVYSKIAVGSLTPIRGLDPYRFWARDILAYARVRATNQLPTQHGRLTATHVLWQYLARVAPQPVNIPTLIAVLYQAGHGRQWHYANQTCGALLCRGPFRRVRRGWYTIAPPRSPPA